MNKEEIEKAREYLKQQEKQDAEETKEDLRTLYKILKNEHREGTLTIERGLKYITKLELEISSYKMIHEHDIAMIDEVKDNAVKWSKERDKLKTILDNITDKLNKMKQSIDKLKNRDGETMIMVEVCIRNIIAFYDEIEKNIIEGEKK